MKRISPDRGKWAQGGVLVSMFALSSCTQSYFTSLTQTSRVLTSVTTPGEIVLPAITDGQLEFKHPNVKFTLVSKSSPVTFTGVTRMVYTSTGSGNTLPAPLSVTSKSGSGTTANLLKQSVVLAGDGAAVSADVPAVWSQVFLDTALSGTTLAEGGARNWFVDVTFEGTNQLGQVITTTVGIPLTIVTSSGT
ncbi:MAG: hypothetical protein VKP72_06570 [bacterium]|nr:hypothetical protein [bacterium]